MVMLSKLVYGDLTKCGITRPTEGPFYMKVKYGKYLVIDVSMYKKIKSGEIQEDEYLLSKDGLPKPIYPNHWKGKNGLYCVGLSRRGLYRISVDSQNVANDIKSIM
nr:putative indole-3-pyruvate monooxygenase yucca10 [Quercus suber]